MKKQLYLCFLCFLLPLASYAQSISNPFNFECGGAISPPTSPAVLSSCSYSTTPGAAVFNLYSLNEATNHFQAPTDQTNPFIYFYHTNPLYTPEVNTRLVPKCDLASTCTPINNFVNVYTNFDGLYTGCLDLNGDGAPGMLPPDIEACQTKECYYAVKAYWESLANEIDGGDKTALLNDLYNSPEALSTYQKYMAASPYLSDEVLGEVAQNVGMMPGRRANILIANAPLSDDMMNLAYTHTSAPVYQTLYALKYYLKISERDRLNMRIAAENDKKEQLLHNLLQKFADEKDYSNLDELLTAENTTYALRALLASKMERNDYSTAQNLLDALPNNTPEEQAYKAVQDINLQFQSATTAFSLSEAQYQTLHGIADAQSYQAPAACALLALLRGEYCDWKLPDDAGSGKTERQGYPQVALPDRLASNRLGIRPNPGKDRVTIALPDALWVEKIAEIGIFDTNGKLWQQSNVGLGQTELNLTIKDLPNGIYLVRMTADGTHIASAKLIVQH